VVYYKDFKMLSLYDDRVKQVIPNTGVLVEDQRDFLLQVIERIERLTDDPIAVKMDIKAAIRSEMGRYNGNKFGHYSSWF
jgi:hypothetical protein